VVGIVFPVYNQGIPFIIKRFIDKFESFSGKYIFGVCTHGGCPGICLKYLNNQIGKKEGRLSGGFSVEMPYNYVVPSVAIKNFYRSFQLKNVPLEKQQKLFDQWENKLEEVCSYIIKRREGRIETEAEVIEYMVDSLNLRETVQKHCWLKIGGFEGKTELSFMESIQLLDYAFTCNDDCIGCGICSKLCPVMNIKMVNNSPQWQHKCEQCFACLNWCPKEAIQFSCKTSGQKRYHNPSITLSDMIGNK
jgi:ferredoxin